MLHSEGKFENVSSGSLLHLTAFFFLALEQSISEHDTRSIGAFNKVGGSTPGLQ